MSTVTRCSGKGERLGYMEGPGSRYGFDPELRFSFFLIQTLSITGQKNFKYPKNGSDSL